MQQIKKVRRIKQAETPGKRTSDICSHTQGRRGGGNSREQINKRKKQSLLSRARKRRMAYIVSILTEKGETLSFKTTHRSGRSYSIDENSGLPYTRARMEQGPIVNTKIDIFSPKSIVSGIIERITVLDTSTDVEPGDKPPIRRPGGH